jgi:hypothetical protein
MNLGLHFVTQRPVNHLMTLNPGFPGEIRTHYDGLEVVSVAIDFNTAASEVFLDPTLDVKRCNQLNPLKSRTLNISENETAANNGTTSVCPLINACDELRPNALRSLR